jgi:cell filamentation protein, protein adenylyltransferase
MELTVLDPFGDYQTEGYLRNLFKEKDLTIVGHLETAAFEDHVHENLRFLRKLPAIIYKHVTQTHKQLFDSVYPWAGQDRSENAPHIAIAKSGYKTLFAHPADVRRAAEYALELAKNISRLRQHPGEVFGYFAHSHPFLEGNGRTILTIYAELCRRAGFYIDWEAIQKDAFLQALTNELLKPGSSMDDFLLPYLREGTLSTRKAVVQLKSNFNRETG